MLFRVFWSVFLFLLVIDQIVAVQPYVPKIANPVSEPWRWKNFSALEGKGVRDIAEQKNGTVWVGVDEGVFEYDGYQWKLHYAGENGLEDAPIQEILTTQDDQIYVISNTQIYTYDGKIWKALLHSPSKFNFNFEKAIELSDHSIMVSSEVGVLHFKNEEKPIFYSSSRLITSLKSHNLNFTWKIFPESLVNEVSFSSVTDILEEESGDIWFAFTFDEAGKLLKFNPAKNTTPSITDYHLYQSGEDIAFGEGQKLIQTIDGKIWVINSSSKVPIHIFSKDKWSTIRLSDEFETDEYTNDIVQTDDGTVWIGALGKLYSFNNTKWNLYQSPSFKIPANKLQLYVGTNNKLWIAGLKSKVYLLDYSYDKWLTYEGLNFQCEVTSEEQWFLDNTGKAISKNGSRWIAWGSEDGFIDSPVRIIVTKYGQVWAAGSHNGVAAIAYLKNEKWYKELHPKLSWGIDYRAVFEAKDGSIWFGGCVDSEYEKGHLGGILQLLNPLESPFEWIHHRQNENGFDQSNSYGIAQTPDGVIWTGGSKLMYYDNNQWQHLDNERLNQYVNTVDNTADLLVVGSRYYGIFIFDGKTWHNYNKENSLSNNTIISIDAIDNDNIWVATENDICHFDGKQWQIFVLPQEINMDFEGGDIKHSMDGSIWINRSERSWKRRAFSHNNKKTNGHKNFASYKFKPDKLPPETYITYFSKEVPVDGNTLIQWSAKDFFEETNDEKLLFSYRINGSPWSPFSPESQHTFLSLPNGKYSLEVRAMDLGGNIDPTPAIVDFSVKPAVWKQLWFIALVTSFLAIIMFFVYNSFTKNKKLEKLNQTLRVTNKKLKEKSNKIRNQNEEILHQKELILNQKESLEINNKHLENQNHEIQLQADKLEEMVEQVEELSKSKITFFTNISHELRTPLSLILGPIGQLRQQPSSISDPERVHLYDIINRNASRLLKLINQLLEIRRIENSSLELQLSEINMGDFLLKIIDFFQNLSKKRNIPLTYNTSSLNMASLLDADKIEKILVNLISNAFKHTPDDGHIELNLEVVDAKSMQLPLLYSSYYHIQVKDSGKGVSPEFIDHIFERYFSRNNLNNKEESSGIGLSYIKDLVDIHRGVIRVESQPSIGSQFDIFIPVISSDQISDSIGQSATLEYNYAQQEIESIVAEYNADLVYENNHINDDKPKILIVEDNIDMLLFLKGLLRNKYHISTALNGKDALKFALDNSLDLILSDIMMPEMNGLELCDHIKSNFATSHLPVILLTAKSLEEHQLEGYEHGADDYIIKPFNPQILELKIGNILKQRSAFQTKLNLEFQISPSDVQLTSPDEEMLSHLVQLMEENIDNSNFNVNAMCESVNLSHMHFIRKVKKLTGKKPIDLLKSFRMKRAKDLLIQNKSTIAEVAYGVGFDMPSSFSRAFKKEFGESPSNFIARLESKA